MVVEGVRNTLAEAPSVAAGLPGATGDRLREQAIETFTDGMRASFPGGALVLAAVAVPGAVPLRRSFPGTSSRHSTHSTADTPEPVDGKPVDS